MPVLPVAYDNGSAMTEGMLDGHLYVGIPMDLGECMQVQLSSICKPLIARRERRIQLHWEHMDYKSTVKQAST